ncbi:hypothetical protein J6590_085198 [Homalodisca vitripennis]|nr:hypothetical protein J6590_085198 [Homalodisca vitripennis]
MPGEMNVLPLVVSSTTSLDPYFIGDRSHRFSPSLNVVLSVVSSVLLPWTPISSETAAIDFHPL